MADQEEWSANANEAVNISFIQAGQTSPVTLSTFHPKFTYPIFGEEECIFGYQGLKVEIRFAAHNLIPNISISHEKKFKAVGDTQALDIEQTLREWMPEVSFQQSSSAFESRIQKDTSAKDWRPPGELIESYTSRSRKFEIWAAELTNPAVQQLIDHIQILVSFFIEGGTPIPLDDQDWSLARWRVFFVYEKLASLPSPNTSPYSLVGYSTTYNFITHQASLTSSTPSKSLTFSLPPPSPFSLSTLPSRARISQFLILPSHQSHSHGTHLYNTLVRTFLSSPHISEITVEDPNEAFDDLRDYCDYARLTANGTFAQIHLAQSLPATLFQKRIGVRVPTGQLLDLPLLHNLRIKNKIAPRQFARLVEMYLLSCLPLATRQSGTARLTQRARSQNESDRQWYYWRLLVKQRVYKRNRDVLMQLDRVERVEKVEETMGEQVGDYERLLRKMGERGMARKTKMKKKKGRVEEVEEEEEEEGNEVRDEAGKGKRKKKKDDGREADETVVVDGGEGGADTRRDRGKRKVIMDEEEELEGTPEPKKVKEGGG
ncbi:MAG: hypothetical protein Q9216_003531 [Gyalolechia sp. 2 TL-2023]